MATMVWTPRFGAHRPSKKFDLVNAMCAVCERFFEECPACGDIRHDQRPERDCGSVFGNCCTEEEIAWALNPQPVDVAGWVDEFGWDDVER